MKKFLKLKICLNSQTDPMFGTSRLCFDKEALPDAPKPKPERISLASVGEEISDSESQEALDNAKKNREERRLAMEKAKAARASLAASLGLPLPPGAADEQPQEGQKKDAKETKEGKDKAPKGKEKEPPKMTGSEFAAGFDKCKTLEEKQKFVLEHAKDFSKDSLKPRIYETVLADGRKVKVHMINNLAIGTPEDSVRLGIDGMSSQAIADMLSGVLPTPEFFQRAYNDPSVQKVPFFYGETLEREWRSRGEHPKPFHYMDGEGVIRPRGEVMQSGEYMAMHSQMLDEWLQSNGIDRNRFMVGSGKTVFAPDQPGAPDGHIVFGGGLYAVPVLNPETGKMGYTVDTSGKTVQGIGDHAHEPGWHDYAARTDIVVGFEIEGEKGVISPKKFFTEEKYESARKELFGANSNINNRYDYPAWMQSYVADYRKTEEAHEPVNEPTPVFSGIAPEKVEKGKVALDDDYTVAHGARGGHVRLVDTEEGNVALFDFNGRDFQVKFDPENTAGVSSTEGYKASTGDVAGPFAYIMLRYFGQKGARVGDFIPFEYDGKQYIAQYQIHGPDASAPTDHPGVGIMQKADTDAVSSIQPAGATFLSAAPALPQSGPQGKPSPQAGNLPAMPGGPGGFSGPAVSAPEISAPPKVSGGKSGGVHVGGGGMSSGGGGPRGPSDVPAPVRSPVSVPQSIPMEVPQPLPQPAKVTSSPYEGREKNERAVIKGNTLFCGDSITLEMPTSGGKRNLNVEGDIKTIAEGSKTVEWLLGQLESYESTGEIDKMKNMVVLIGTNNIGGNQTAQTIFDKIEKIWAIGIKHNLKVYACTIPPVKGWGAWGDSGPLYERTNKKRKDINTLISTYAGPNKPEKVIKLDELMADPADPDRLAPEYDYNGKGDHLHPNKQRHARLLESEIGEQKTTDQPAEPPKPVEAKVETDDTTPGELEGFEKSPFFDEKIKTYKFPEALSQSLRVHINAPGNFDKKKPTRIVVFALPAGNTIEQTIGARKKEGQDWHYDIQQIGAQTRKLREASQGENIVITYVEAPMLNPGAWMQGVPGRGESFGKLIDDVKQKIGVPTASVDISSHSAGRSLQFSYIDEVPEIPKEVKRLTFLDSNHSYNAARGEKMIKWLQEPAQDHYLSVISYDDRNVTLNGKPVPGAIGYLRTYELIDQFQKGGIDLTREQKNGYVSFKGLNGRVNILIMDNPANKILHTETVYRNGFIYGETAGTELEGRAGDFNGPTAFNQYIQPEATALT